MKEENLAAKIVTAARTCVGTPFHHQGRQPGIGLDCIGLIVIALRAIGYDVSDRTDYSPRPDGQSLVNALKEHGMTRTDNIQAGCILLFRYDHQPQHVALATGTNTMIHSFAPARQVVETVIGPYWQRRLLGVYQINGIRD